MNLVEGELIEQIEQIDEGWWSGVGEGGAKSGLFPGKLPHDVLGSDHALEVERCPQPHM